MILKTQSRKKPNNPFKRLLKQHIILCAFQNSQVRRDKEIFWCVQLKSDWLNCFVTKGIACLISSFRVGYVEDWLNLENELPTSPQMSDEEILATVVGDSTESESVCSDEEDEGEDEKIVSTKEAAQCFKKCLSWMESQNDIDPVQLMQLRRMMDFAMRSSCKSLKQTNMLEHFRPL